MPFTASTLQIGGYDSYQHRNLQAAQVTITEPDSAVSTFETSSATLLKVCRVGPPAPAADAHDYEIQKLKLFKQQF